jgi:DNA polymerase III sliding clamp (beta) subunit (PCNA family)
VATTEIDYHGPQLLLPQSHGCRAILSGILGGEEVSSSWQDGTSCTVTCGNGTWTLPTESAAEFPTWTPTSR